MARVSPLLWLLIAFGAILSLTAVGVAMYVDEGSFNKYVGIAGVLVNFFGFVLVSQQLRASSHATENQTRWEIEQVSFNVYQMLVDRPELRPYFYDGVAPPLDGLERSRIDAACELLLDYFETIVGSGATLDDPSEAVWSVYMKQVYANSPALSTFLKREWKRYRPDLIELLDHGFAQQVLPKPDPRRRRTNAPH